MIELGRGRLGAEQLVKPGAGPRADVAAGVAPPLHVRLAGEWLLSFDSPHTRDAYRRDAGAYFSWCAEFGIDPLTAVALHADGFRQYTAGVLGKKASRARRLAAVSSFYRFGRRRHPSSGWTTRSTRSPVHAPRGRR